MGALAQQLERALPMGGAGVFGAQNHPVHDGTLFGALVIGQRAHWNTVKPAALPRLFAKCAQREAAQKDTLLGLIKNRLHRRGGQLPCPIGLFHPAHQITMVIQPQEPAGLPLKGCHRCWCLRLFPCGFSRLTLCSLCIQIHQHMEQRHILINHLNPLLPPLGQRHPKRAGRTIPKKLCLIKLGQFFAIARLCGLCRQFHLARGQQGHRFAHQIVHQQMHLLARSFKAAIGDHTNQQAVTWLFLSDHLNAQTLHPKRGHGGEIAAVIFRMAQGPRLIGCPTVARRVQMGCKPIRCSAGVKGLGRWCICLKIIV